MPGVRDIRNYQFSWLPKALAGFVAATFIVAIKELYAGKYMRMALQTCYGVPDMQNLN